LFQSIKEIQERGASWVGLQIDTGFGTKIRDRMVVEDCAPLVGLCRPVLYGLAAGGKEGVAGIDNGITSELKRIMSLVGARDLDSISREILISDRNC